MNFVNRTLSKSMILRLRPAALREVAPYSSRFLSGSGSITYSGGQATEGQGGFYGSGGARAVVGSAPIPDGVEDRQVVLAIASDVQTISAVMDEVDRLESLLDDTAEGGVTSKSIEIKASIKKLMTSPDVVEALNRLEIGGLPVWGLSAEERELIIMAREKMNSS